MRKGEGALVTQQSWHESVDMRLGPSGVGAVELAEP